MSPCAAAAAAACQAMQCTPLASTARSKLSPCLGNLQLCISTRADSCRRYDVGTAWERIVYSFVRPQPPREDRPCPKDDRAIFPGLFSVFPLRALVNFILAARWLGLAPFLCDPTHGVAATRPQTANQHAHTL
eukprot:GHVT01078902.1.p2 GENE.GHVT01078902.1~~GHVT01078902.1.p2  ORF type:complete len:133 (-),score=21.16 GHVT01078902.1:28-426(-)